MFLNFYLYIFKKISLKKMDDYLITINSTSTVICHRVLNGAVETG